jgi:hypothetical protein
LVKVKNEIVSVSFHFLNRVVKSSDGKEKLVKFSEQEFEDIFQKISKLPAIDMKNEAALNRLRYRIEVPIENCVRVDARTVFGVYRSSYWGHSYDNTARGKIPADSISLRPFYFLLYLSESGKLYLGSQYLGQFGGYTAIQNTIRGYLANPETINSSSFRLGNSQYANAQAKEIRVSFTNRASSISAENKITSRGMVAFKKAGKEDGFELNVRTRLLPFLGKPQDEVRKAVASILNEGDLMDINDSDIEDCVIIANVNGRQKTIYMLEGGNFATKFPLEVNVGSDGHPLAEATKSAMIAILTREIIARAENV